MKMEYGEHFVDGLVEEASKAYSTERDFTTLKAWRNARKVKLFFYKKILPGLPKEELYDLGSQIRESAVRYQEDQCMN